MLGYPRTSLAHRAGGILCQGDRWGCCCWNLKVISSTAPCAIRCEIELIISTAIRTWGIAPDRLNLNQCQLCPNLSKNAGLLCRSVARSRWPAPVLSESQGLHYLCPPHLNQRDIGYINNLRSSTSGPSKNTASPSFTPDSFHRERRQHTLPAAKLSHLVAPHSQEQNIKTFLYAAN